MRGRGSEAVDLVKRAEGYLERRGVPNARRNAEWMLVSLLGCRRAELYLDPHRPVDPETEARFEELVRRRGDREPLQYILGSVEFMSLPFVITEGVFIPRFETELLVEHVEKQLAETQRTDGARVLDLCSGSGVIAVSLAKRLPGVFAVGVEQDPAAVDLARENAKLNGVEDRTDFVAGEAVGFLVEDEGVYDAVISNPPYIARGELEELPPEVRRHEPLAALDGGEDGMDFHRNAASHLAPRLAPGGFAAFEIGAAQGAAVSEMFAAASLVNVEIIKDYNGFDRVVMGFKPSIYPREGI